MKRRPIPRSVCTTCRMSAVCLLGESSNVLLRWWVCRCCKKKFLVKMALNGHVTVPGNFYIDSKGRPSLTDFTISAYSGAGWAPRTFERAVPVSCPNDSTTEDRYGMYCCIKCGGPLSGWEARL